MIASAMGSPSVAARATDSGVPPIATQIGSFPGTVADTRQGCRSARVYFLPGDLFAFIELDQQIKFVREKDVVLLQVVTEQRKRFNERTAASHDLGSSARQ